MFKRKGGGVKGLLNNVKKTALFLKDGFPNLINLIVTCLNNATSFSEGKIFFAAILKLNFILDGSKGMYG